MRSLAEALRGRHGCEVHVIPLDLTDPRAPAALYAAVNERRLHVDVLVNNAGYGVPGGFLARDLTTHLDFQQVMVNSIMELCHRFAPDMRARGCGTILNVASLAGLVPSTGGHTLYGPAKAWLIKYSEGLACELAPFGVQVCALCPGFTHTEFHDANGMRADVSRLPGYLWMAAEDVVREAFDALAKGRSVHVCGRLNRAIAMLARWLPAGWCRALVARHTADFRRID